ncbi:PEBP-like protein [Mycena crocata]|nr:PEBP-like protein [Mycena crocata]
MHFTQLASLLSLLLVTAAQDTSLRAVDQAFRSANIPTDLGIVFKPEALLEVTFPRAGKKPVTLHAGVHVPRNDTAGPPTFDVVGHVGKGPFVVAMIDLDAPPEIAQVRHFLGGDFYNKGGCLTNSTPAVTDFIQPAPPAGSGAHRYTFLVYKQSDAFAQQQLVNATTPILQFNIAQFAAAVDLGNPIAGTFMLVAADAT